MPTERRWSDDDRELVARTVDEHRTMPLDHMAAAVLDALTAAGWHQAQRNHVCIPADVEAT